MEVKGGKERENTDFKARSMYFLSYQINLVPESKGKTGWPVILQLTQVEILLLINSSRNSYFKENL